jgi:eukaryotic-like serine/threonine-protein kinase
MSQVPSRFWQRLGLAGPSGHSEEGREFLQRRVSLYLGLVSLLWVAVGVASVASAWLFWPAIFEAPQAELSGIVHYGGSLGLIVCWLLSRRGRQSARALDAWDAATTIAQAVVMSLIMHATDLRYRPDLNMALGLSCTLLGRAAIVPSRGGRSLLIGCVASLPILVATYFTHARLLPTERLMPPPVAVTQIGTWLVFSVLVSGTISKTIYGLTSRVRAAARLGQYVLQHKIGEGGMGVVYLARHALLRRPTAIKLLGTERRAMGDIRRFEREVQTTSTLRHPNTVAIYDYGRTPDGEFYYAMEYLDGVDLEQLRIAEGPLPEGRVVHILLQVAGALEEAHSAGLIHRDIKPSNVLLCDYGPQADFAKVVDFGLVKDMADEGAELSQTDGLAGTPLYISPEAITSPQRLDGRSDLYALGAVGYAMLTGRPPFEGKTIVQVCAAHLSAPVIPPSEVRGEGICTALEKVILDCLAKDPDQRPSSASQLSERLEACAVTPWTVSDARRWWDTRGAELRRERDAGRVRSVSSDTIAVDWTGRGK